MTSATTSLSGLFGDSIKANWDRPALSDYKGRTFAYREVGAEILRHHTIFTSLSLKQGDKVALLGKNSAEWGIVYLSVVTYGAVIVPILPDFKPSDVQSIIRHSDSVVLFVEEEMYKELDVNAIDNIRLTLDIQGRKVLKAIPGIEDILPGKLADGGLEGISREDIRFPLTEPDALAEISYTSGTSGYSKGVMLPHRSLQANILYAHRNMPLKPDDRILSFLPMAHAFGCTFEFLFPFTLGCEITFLNKIPSPTTIITAFQEIKPALILTVPLMIEKIYKNRVKPGISKPLVRILLGVPLVNNLILRKIYDKLYQTFGGNLKELVIGGAPFNPEVECFFRRIGFPFTVGYGMTECGPLISYASWKTTRPGAAGRVVDELELVIDSPDPFNIPGEIRVRGSHVMTGYYKNDEESRKVLDEEGWLSTGDIALKDAAGNIYIKGRSKSLILGPSGQNIYPEELESMLNSKPIVLESLIVERDQKLFALICPDKEAMAAAGVIDEQVEHIFRHYVHEINHHVPKYMRIADFEIRKTEFEKTPKRNPKRFLYK